MKTNKARNITKGLNFEMSISIADSLWQISKRYVAVETKVRARERARERERNQLSPFNTAVGVNKGVGFDRFKDSSYC